MLIAEFEEHRKEAVIYCFRVEKLCEFSKVLCKDQLHPPLILRFGHSLLVLEIFNELVAVLWLHFCQENVQVLKCSQSNLINWVLKESFHYGY